MMIRTHPAFFAVIALLLAPEASWAAQGVNRERILLGVTSAFRGHAAALGSELYRGYQAAFLAANEAGGVKGRRVELVTHDDGYDPARAVHNAIRLVEDDEVFMLFGNVGTPTTVKVLPLLLKYRDLPMYMVAPFSGAQQQRQYPYVPFVINVRASYAQETAALVRHFLAQGHTRIAVFHQNDAYGRSGQAGVAAALAGKELTTAVEVNYPRGARYTDSMVAHAGLVIQAKADAVIAVGSYQPCAAFVRDARRAGFTGPIANISFVGAEPLLALLIDQGQKDGRDYTTDLVNSQVVPHYNNVDLPLVARYRQDMERLRPQLPPDLRDPTHKTTGFSFISLEGYLNATVLLAALKQADEPLTPRAVMRAIESTGELDLGLDRPLHFGPGDHQGMDSVYLVTVANGTWVPLK